MENYRRMRMAGMLYAVAAALWMCWVLGWELLTGEIPQTGSPYFYVNQIVLILLQTAMLAGFFGLWWGQAVGRGTFGKIAFGLGVVGHFLFVLAEIFSLVTGSDGLLPVAALASIIGLTLTGIAVLRAGRWQGWSRYTPLLAGLYPLGGMFPFLIIYGQLSYIGIGLWGLFRLFLGLAMLEQANFPVANRSEETRRTLRTESS